MQQIIIEEINKRRIKPTEMKKSISILAFVLFFLVGGKALQAQFKIAYIYSDSLIVLMPETKEADSAVAKFSKIYEDALAKKDNEYQEKYKQYQDMITKNGGREPVGDPIFNLLVSDLQELTQKINKLQQTAQTEVTKKRQEAYEPVIKKAKDAIEAVAKEKGYNYVLDASIGAILYSSPNDNIIEDVKKKLGIK